MKHYKSERLKKLEVELNDLEQWLKLGLVPKRDLDKHKEEIRSITGKIEEEKERLQFLRESGEAEEYITPKRAPTRGAYTEMPTLPDIDMAETHGGNYQESNYDAETDHGEGETTLGDTKEEDGEDEEEAAGEEDEESYFSDKNRWRRGGNIVDPDANEW